MTESNVPSLADLITGEHNKTWQNANGENLFAYQVGDGFVKLFFRNEADVDQFVAGITEAANGKLDSIHTREKYMTASCKVVNGSCNIDSGCTAPGTSCKFVTLDGGYRSCGCFS